MRRNFHVSRISRNVEMAVNRKSCDKELRQ